MDINSKTTLLTGNQIPIMGLGTWELTEDTAGIIAQAISLGYPMIDTSSDYGTQPGVGEGIKKSDISRESLYIVTKVEDTDDSYARTHFNLKELDLEYVDLMLIHRPPEDNAGEELWEGLIKAKNEGLVKDIGVSNYSSDQINALIDASGEVPVVNQIEWSPFGNSRAMKEFCDEKGIKVQAYSPLTRTEQLDHPTLEKLSAKHGKTPAQIMIRWNLQLGTIPIPKASEVKHLKENINVFDFELTEEDIKLLNRLNEKFSALGELPYISSHA
jgi:diketogulonate reductase-like aldo/keto reductase